MAELRVDLTVRVRPLDDPAPQWCDEHALPCVQVQHFALMVSLDGGPESPYGVIRAEAHE